MMNRPDGGWGAPDVAWADDGAAAERAEAELEVLRASALRQARRLVEFYRITPQELLHSGGSGLENPASESAVPDLPVKYRHPVTGDTWDGVGLHPQWMRQALLQDGYRVEELRVNPIEEKQHARPAA